MPFVEAARQAMAHGHAFAQTLWGLLLFTGNGAPTHKIKALVSQYDKNNDGKLSWSGFDFIASELSRLKTDFAEKMTFGSYGTRLDGSDPPPRKP